MKINPIKSIKGVRTNVKIKAIKPLESVGINNFAKDIYDVKIGEFKPIFSDKSLSYNLPKLNFRNYSFNSNIKTNIKNIKPLVSTNINYYSATFTLPKYTPVKDVPKETNEKEVEFINKYSDYIYGNKSIYSYIEDLVKKKEEEYLSQKKIITYNNKEYRLTDEEAKYFFSYVRLYPAEKAYELAIKMAGKYVNDVIKYIDPSIIKEATEGLSGFNNLNDNDMNFVYKLFSTYNYWDDNITEELMNDKIGAYLGILAGQHSILSSEEKQDFSQIYYLSALNRINQALDRFSKGIYQGSFDSSTLNNFFGSKLQINKGLSFDNMDLSNIPEIAAVSTIALQLGADAGLSTSFLLGGTPLPPNIAIFASFALGLYDILRKDQYASEKEALSTPIRIFRSDRTLMNFEELNAIERKALDKIARYINDKSKAGINSKDLYDNFKYQYVYAHYLYPAQIKYNYIIDSLKKYKFNS